MSMWKPDTKSKQLYLTVYSEAPKITGMLIDQPLEAVVIFCSNRDLFNQQVDQAY